MRHRLLPEAALTLRRFLIDYSTSGSSASVRSFLRLRFRRDTTAAGDEFSVSRAASALHRADANGVLAELKSHTFAHYPHGLRKELTNLWFGALYMKAERKKGGKLSAIERKAIMFDAANAPPPNVGVINRPQFTAPAGVNWP